MSFLTFICGVRYIGTLGGYSRFFQETGMIEWGQNAKPKKIPDQKLTPQTIPCRFPSLDKFGCTLFAELRDRDTPRPPPPFLPPQIKNPSKIPVT